MQVPENHSSLCIFRVADEKFLFLYYAPSWEHIEEDTWRDNVEIFNECQQKTSFVKKNVCSCALFVMQPEKGK